MGRRHRAKDVSKIAGLAASADRLKDARHEFQTLPSSFPISRHLLLEEIKRLENEKSDDACSISSHVSQTKGQQVGMISTDNWSSVDSQDKKNSDGPQKEQENTTEANPIINGFIQPRVVHERVDMMTAKFEGDICDPTKFMVYAGAPEFHDLLSPRCSENEKWTMKIFIPHHDYPGYNFIGRLLGPRGVTMKHLQKASGCRMYIRGKGSLRLRDPSQEHQLLGAPGYEHLAEDLHVLIEYDGPESERLACMTRAEAMVVQLLRPPASDELDDLKKEQLRELAILNGTYKENKTLQPCTNKRVTAAPQVLATEALPASLANAGVTAPAVPVHLLHPLASAGCVPAPAPAGPSSAGPDNCKPAPPSHQQMHLQHHHPQQQQQQQPSATALHQQMLLLQQQQHNMMRMVAMMEASRTGGGGGGGGGDMRHALQHPPRGPPPPPFHAAPVGGGGGFMGGGMPFTMADDAPGRGGGGEYEYAAPHAVGGGGGWVRDELRAAAHGGGAAAAAAAAAASRLRPTSAPFQPMAAAGGGMMTVAGGRGDLDENCDPNRGGGGEMVEWAEDEAGACGSSGGEADRPSGAEGWAVHMSRSSSMSSSGGGGGGGGGNDGSSGGGATDDNRSDCNDFTVGGLHGVSAAPPGLGGGAASAAAAAAAARRLGEEGGRWTPLSPCLLTQLPRTPLGLRRPTSAASRDGSPAPGGGSGGGADGDSLSGDGGGGKGFRVSPSGGPRPRWHPYVRSPPACRAVAAGGALEVRLGTSLARSESGAYRLF